MTAEHTSFAAVRSLLQQPPSQEVWEALRELLDVQPDASDDLIDYVSAHTSRWPSRIRRAADEDAFDWFEDARPSWSLASLNSVGITQAHHLPALRHAPWAHQLAHLRIDLPALPTAPALVGLLRALPALESIELNWSLLYQFQARSTPLIKALSEHWPPHLTHLALPCPTSHRAVRLLGARLHGLTSLAITIDARMAATLFGTPGITHLKTLELCDEHRRGELTTIIAHAPGLGQLTSLTISDAVGDELLDLIAAPHMQRLELLDCAPHLSVDATHRLLTMPWPPRLTLKDIHHIPQDARGYALLAQHPCMARVMSAHHHWPDLLTCPHPQALERLTLYSPAYTETLTSNPSLCGLRALYIDDRQLGLDELTALARCTHLTELRTFRASRAGFGLEHLRILVTAPWFPQLEHLNLADNALHDDALSSLAAALPPNLRSLSLEDNRLSASGLAALLESPICARLECLDLTGTLLGPAGIALLVKHPALGAIYGTASNQRSHHNMFTGMEIGDAELMMILDSPHFVARPSLSFSYNNITDAGFAALAKHPRLRSVRYLCVDCEEDALLGLLSSPNADRLHYISTLYYCGITKYTWLKLSNLSHLSPTMRASLHERYKMTKPRNPSVT